MEYKISRPTPTAIGTTNYYDEDGDYEKRRYKARLHCVQCGFINRAGVTQCAVCESRNWDWRFGK